MSSQKIWVLDPLPVDRGTRDGDLFDLGELEEA